MRLAISTLSIEYKKSSFPNRDRMPNKSYTENAGASVAYSIPGVRYDPFVTEHN